MTCGRSIFFLFLALLACGGGAVGASDQFNLPDDTPAAATGLAAIRISLSQSQVGNAVTVEQALLHEHPFDLVTVESGLLMSVWADLASISGPDGQALAAENTRQWDAEAHTALQNLKVSGQADALACYDLAQRYPRTPTAAAALALAGDLAASAGDLPGARDLYAAAVKAGAELSAQQQRRIGEITRALTPSRDAYCGPLPFRASWFAHGSTGAHVFPWVAGSTFYILTPRRILAADASGRLLWANALSLPLDMLPKPVDPNTAHHHHWHPIADLLSSFSPEIFSVDGAAQVVIARCGRDSGATPLMAFSPEDGQTLWSTADDASLSALYFSPSPAINGRYVYDLAVDPVTAPGALYLVALDLCSGHELWRTTLGSLSPTMQRIATSQAPAGAGYGWDFFQLPNISFAGEQMLLTPCVGELFDVDRFNGRIRWIRDYAAKPTADPRAVASRPRYEGRPVVAGDTVVCAPQDSTGVQAYSLGSGGKLWESDDFPRSTLVGGAGSTLVLLSDGAQAIDASNGHAVWSFEPTHGMGKLDGPGMIDRGLLYLPTNTGIMVLSVANGDAAASPLRLPNWYTALQASPLRDALEVDGALMGFVLSRPFMPRPVNNREPAN